MWLLVEGTEIEITDNVIPKQSMLWTLKNTNIGTKKIVKDIKTLYILDTPLVEMVILKNFLEKGKVYIEPARIIKILDYFNIEMNEYDIRVASEIYIRKNLYKEPINEEFKNFYYGLIRMESWDHTVKKIAKPTCLYDDICPTRKPPNMAMNDLTQFQFLFEAFPNTFVIAGGRVLESLYNWNEKSKDIDLFIYGIRNEEDAEKISVGIIRCIDAHLSVQSVSRSQHAITIHTPTIQFQIIMRLYQNPFEIIFGFDIDCCAILWNGKDIYTTPRCLYAIENWQNSVTFNPDLPLFSPSYEARLLKYAKRGFGIYIPDLHLAKERNIGYDYEHKPFSGLDLLLEYNIKRKIPKISDYAYNDNDREIWKCTFDENFPYENLDLNIIRFLINTYAKVAKYNESYDIINIRFAYSSQRPELIEYFFNLPSIFPDLVSARIKDMTSKRDKWKINISQFETHWRSHRPGEQLTNTFHSVVYKDKLNWYNPPNEINHTDKPFNINKYKIYPCVITYKDIKFCIKCKVQITKTSYIKITRGLLFNLPSENLCETCYDKIHDKTEEYQKVEENISKVNHNDMEKLLKLKVKCKQCDQTITGAVITNKHGFFCMSCSTIASDDEPQETLDKYDINDKSQKILDEYDINNKSQEIPDQYCTECDSFITTNQNGICDRCIDISRGEY